jgi:hypothetical protein
VNEYAFFQQAPTPSNGAVYQNTTDPIKIFDDGKCEFFLKSLSYFVKSMGM